MYRHSEEIKRKMSLDRKGKKFSEEHRKNLSLANKKRSGEKHHLWKGENVSYKSLHEWVRNHLNKPIFCEVCRKVTPTEVANITNDYKRNLADWIWVCRSCHAKYDNIIRNLTNVSKIDVRASS